MTHVRVPRNLTWLYNFIHNKFSLHTDCRTMTVMMNIQSFATVINKHVCLLTNQNIRRKLFVEGRREVTMVMKSRNKSSKNAVNFVMTYGITFCFNKAEYKSVIKAISADTDICNDKKYDNLE